MVVRMPGHIHACVPARRRLVVRLLRRPAWGRHHARHILHTANTPEICAGRSVTTRALSVYAHARKYTTRDVINQAYILHSKPLRNEVDTFAGRSVVVCSPQSAQRGCGRPVRAPSVLVSDSRTPPSARQSTCAQAPRETAGASRDPFAAGLS